MPTLLRSFGSFAVMGSLLLAPPVLRAQNAFSPGGGEYAIAGSLIGDQAFPRAVIGPTGGYLVWQDNAADNDGLGVNAVRLDSGLRKTGPIFRVNSTTIGDQEKPQLAALANGGAVFVWQSGKQGFQKIYARFLPATGTNFLAANILVNTYTNSFQIDPVVATLTDGSVVVIWASDGQDGSYQGVYGQRLSATGTKIGSEFRVNEFTSNNQRSPAVAALAGGGFVVTWISELERGPNSIDVYARLYNSAGSPLGSEFPVNVGNPMCATPTVVGSPAGGFAVAWAARDIARVNSSSISLSGVPASAFPDNSWDIVAAIYDVNGGVATALGAPFRLNSRTYGDQTVPKLATFGGNYLCTWVSLGQDGAWEGVYGQFFSGKGELAGVEFRVNSTTAGRQFQPSVCSDGVNKFLVTWSSFVANTGFDLMARAYDLIRVEIAPVSGGLKISWNTQPGSIYQVQVSTNYVSWTSQGAARQATALSDSIVVSPQSSVSAYRVIRVQ